MAHHVNSSRASAIHRFSDGDRNVLAAEAGIGDRVIERLEQAGFSTLAQMKAAGADQVVHAVCSLLGSTAWRNRKRSIERAIAHAASGRAISASQECA